MKNPIDFIVERWGKTRADATVDLGVGKNLLLRLSQGRLQNVTAHIADKLWSLWDKAGIERVEFVEEYGTDDLDAAYQEWVHHTRRAKHGRVPTRIVDDPKIPPFARVVAAVGSVSKTAKLLSVADMPVQKYAKGKQTSMPGPIREALNEMGYPYTKDLETAQTRWIEKNRA